MRWRGLVLVLALFSACSGTEVAERYQAEQMFFKIDRQLVKLRQKGDPIPLPVYRKFAADFEAVARAIPQRESLHLKELEGRAWLRAAECRFAVVDSGQAELVLAITADRFVDVPSVLGEASHALGRVHERHGHYRAAMSSYRAVVELVEPDPGPDPRNPPNPDDPPEELTATDFVLGLPLHVAHLAARDTTVVDAGLYYQEAEDYYRAHLDDASPFVRIESRFLLGDVLADRGMWDEASRTVDAIEGRIPGIVLARFESADARLASVSYQMQALCFGKADADSVRLLVEDLVRDYAYGDYAPAALFKMAQCMQRLGKDEQAHRDLARLVRDYPTAPVVPEAQLLRAHLFANEGNWRDARRTLRSLPLEFPTSDAALRAPLEIADYYRGLGDGSAEREALQRAEDQYLEILGRYPSGPHSYATREKLVTVLDRQGRRLDATLQLIAMCDVVAEPAQKPALLAAAARRFELQLRQPARAEELYRRLADEFPDTRLGRAALRDANRLAISNEK